MIAIIGLLISILLPSLSRAKESARTVACGSNLRTISTGFQLYAGTQKNGALTSGAFDHLRDGDIRYFGWVADMVNLKVGSPGSMLCPSNRWQINEKVADYTGAASTGSPNPNRPHPVPVVPVGTESEELWNKGYNSNYASTWYLVRGDPTAADGYGTDGSTADPSKCPGDGDGPLNDNHIGNAAVSADKIPIMGDARVGDSSDSSVTQAYADTINGFAGQTVINTGDFTVESFTDGMAVDISAQTGDAGAKGHEFNDIAPLHSPKSGDYIGGFANVLFADGHVGAVHDTGGENDQADGYLGAFKPGNTGSTFIMNTTAWDEIRNNMWVRRLRPKPLAGGGSSE